MHFDLNQIAFQAIVAVDIDDCFFTTHEKEKFTGLYVAIGREIDRVAAPASEDWNPLELGLYDNRSYGACREFRRVVMTQKPAAGKALALKALGPKPAALKPKSPAAGAKARPAPKPANQFTNKATTPIREVQLNGTSDKYWKARGLDRRPQNWETLLKDAGDKTS